MALDLSFGFAPSETPPVTNTPEASQEKPNARMGWLWEDTSRAAVTAATDGRMAEVVDALRGRFTPDFLQLEVNFVPGEPGIVNAMSIFGG